MGKRQGIMLAHTYENGSFNRWQNSEVYVQPKYNGQRCVASFDGISYHLYSSEGNEINSLPHINRALNLRTGCDYKRPTFDGELYLHGMSRQDISSRVKRMEPHPDFEAIQYHIFDIINDKEQFERFDTLDDYKPHFKDSHLVVSPTYIILKEEEFMILNYMTKFLNEGFEGVILRNYNGFYEKKRSFNLLKLKPSYSMTCDIIGCFEAHDMYGVPKGMLGGLHLKDAEGNLFDCGAGKLSHDLRTIIWQLEVNSPNHLKGRKAEIKYAELSNDGIPQQPILIRII